MKNLIKVLIIPVAIIILISCNKDDEPVIEKTYYIKKDSSDTSVPSFPYSINKRK